MFLKRLERRKNGKKHTYWPLVESIRTERGSRHRVVAYLGELTKRDGLSTPSKLATGRPPNRSWRTSSKSWLDEEPERCSRSLWTRK